MPARPSADASVLNHARPRIMQGVEAVDVGWGEAAVGHPDLPGRSVLPVAALRVLPLLDGNRTLNEVGLALLRETGAASHLLVIETVSGLHAAGLLDSLDPAVGRFLVQQRIRKVEPAFLRFLAAVGRFRLLVPLQARAGSGVQETGSGEGGRDFAGHGRGIQAVLAALSVLVLAGLAIAVTWLALRMGSPARIVGFHGQRAAWALLALLGGALAAVSVRAVGEALALRLLGRSVRGIGLGLTAGIPHLAFDARDAVLLDRSHRLVLALATLASAALVPAVATGARLAGVPFWSRAIAAGGLLVVLADLSPFWRSSASCLLQELLGTRRLHAKSVRYLLRKLWRDVFGRGKPDRDDTAMMATATLALVYLFIAVGVLAVVALATADSLTAAFMNPRASAAMRVPAVLATAYIWLALLAACLGVLATAVAALLHLLLPADRPGLPAACGPISGALSQAELAARVGTLSPFLGLAAPTVEAILSKGKTTSHPKGSCIIRQGDEGDACFVVKGGVCRIEVEDAAGTRSPVAWREAGELFGEAALLDAAPRNAWVVAETDAELVSLDRDTFLAAVASAGLDPAQVADRLRLHLFLRRLPLFRTLGAPAMARVAASVRTVETREAAVVLREGDPGDTMYVVYRGSVEVAKKGAGRVAVLRSGDVFGEIAVVTGETRTATVTALEPCVLAELPKAIYHEVLAGEFSAALLLEQQATQRLESLSLV